MYLVCPIYISGCVRVGDPKSNLDGSLEDSMAPEPLNNRICVACDSSQISRRVLVKSAPEVLVIQLNRVLPDGTKDSTVV